MGLEDCEGVPLATAQVLGDALALAWAGLRDTVSVLVTQGEEEEDSPGVLEGVKVGANVAAVLPLCLPDADSVPLEVGVGAALPLPPLAPPSVTLAEEEVLGEGEMELVKEGLGLPSGDALPLSVPDALGVVEGEREAPLVPEGEGEALAQAETLPL